MSEERDWRFSRPVQTVIAAAQVPFDVEWTENPASWPHCNGQAGCWMHVSEPWCWCECRWCATARRAGQGGGEAGECRLCGGTTQLGRDPAPKLCAGCSRD